MFAPKILSDIQELEGYYKAGIDRKGKRTEPGEAMTYVAMGYRQGNPHIL